MRRRKTRQIAIRRADTRLPGLGGIATSLTIARRAWCGTRQEASYRWRSKEAGGSSASPLGHRGGIPAIAPHNLGGCASCIDRIVSMPGSVTASCRFGRSHSQWRVRLRNRWQHRLIRVTPSLHRAYIGPSQSTDGRVATAISRHGSSCSQA